MEVQEPEVRAHISQFGIPTLPMKTIDAFSLHDELSQEQNFPRLVRKSIDADLVILPSYEDAVKYLARNVGQHVSGTYFLTELPEFYYALDLTMEHDRVAQQPVLRAKLVLTEETTFDHDFDKRMVSVHIDPLVGLRGYQVASIFGDLNVPRNMWRQLTLIAQQLYECYKESDATAVSLNPLLILRDDKVIAAGTSMDVDINAAFRQQSLIGAITGSHRYVDGRTVHYTPLRGQIGCLANGAGLSMAVMDMIVHLSDGLVHPANFLDICGSTQIPQIEEALRLVFSHKEIELLLVIVNGGVIRCDKFAEALIDIYRGEGTTLPVVVRFAGNNAKEGEQIIREADIPSINLANTLDEAVLQAISLVNKDMHVHPN